MMIDQQTCLYGVVGKPIGHSMSPVMHNAAFRETGLNAVYLAFETEDLRGVLRGVRAFGIKGMSITIPFKTAVMPFLDKVDPLAEKIGAVNTIVNRKDGLVGYNTDALGALKALEEKVMLSGKRCLIVGAGGAARAVGFVLKEKGADIILANRSEETGKTLARALECPFLLLDHAGEIEADILIQTTPVGMFPRSDQTPVPERTLRGGMVVMDVIYNPTETKLLETARARGCIPISGLHMFVFQGAEQFTLWTGREAPIRTMEKAVVDALARMQDV